MNNLDKDIERLKELKNIKVAINSAFYSTGTFELDEEDKQAIENVLKELSNLKWKNEIYVKSIKSHKETIEKKDKELETYKKIAEKLAEEWFDFDELFMIRGKNIHSAKELIDWARKEVENEL